MFIASQVALHKFGLCKFDNIQTYSIGIGLVIYASIYLYLLYNYDELIPMFNKFIIYIICIDLLLSTVYYMGVSPPNDDNVNGGDIKQIDNQNTVSESKTESETDTDTESDTESDLDYDSLDLGLEPEQEHQEPELDTQEQVFEHQEPELDTQEPEQEQEPEQILDTQTHDTELEIKPKRGRKRIIKPTLNL